MLRFFSLSNTCFDSGWAIHPLSGSLLKFSPDKTPAFRAANIPKSILKAYDFCVEPYKLNPTISQNDISIPTVDKKLDRIYKRLARLKGVNFYLAVLYASFQTPLYADSQAAIQAINRLFPDDPDPESCLQRSLTVAKVSKSFYKDGVLFIGAQLPLKSMHAWIIEGKIQPDAADRQWINFFPLIAFKSRDDANLH